MDLRRDWIVGVLDVLGGLRMKQSRRQNYVCLAMGKRRKKHGAEKMKT